MTREAVSCEINVKLVFHEMPWKKNFIAYPSLYTEMYLSFVIFELIFNYVPKLSIL